MESRFNVIDEPWIPVVDVGRVSLRQVFSEPAYRALGGSPSQKIAVTKLLLSITQAACTPANQAEWHALGSEGLAQRCSAYLEHWYDRFYLYGEQPFLQMPAIKAAAVQSFGAVLPEVSSGNTTVLSQWQIERPLADADRALLLVTLMGLALGGKKTDNSVTLSPGYTGKKNDKGKASTGKPGPSVAHMGLLHSFLQGSHLLETLWLNVLTLEQVTQSQRFEAGIGVAPWEQMPSGEACPVAHALTQSLQGRLVPLCRFCLLTEDGLHYSEGIAHPGYKEGMADPSVAVNSDGKEPKALWANPEKRPWRELPALLSFIEETSGRGFQSVQMSMGLRRAGEVLERVGIWSGGLRVSSNAGEQYVSGSDDSLESLLWLDTEALGALWFATLKAEIQGLDTLAKHLYGCVMGFFKEQKVEGGNLAAQATHLFWQLCERDAQRLFNHCDSANEESPTVRQQLRQRFSGHIYRLYDQFCPKETARQLEAWAKCRPSTSKYLAQEA